MIRDGVTLVMRSTARKLTIDGAGRPVAATHVAQTTCPTGCAWRGGGGCYAEAGPEGYVTRRLAASASASTGAGAGGDAGSGDRGAGSADGRALWASLAEARAIWGAAARAGDGIRGVPLRLHVVGDAAGGPGAIVLGRAAWGWRGAGGGPVWTYTHRWREIARGAWGPIGVLASCETIADVAAARSRGYVGALVTDRDVKSLGRGFVCPAQTGARADCYGCMACARVGRPGGVDAGAPTLILRPHGNSRTMKRRLAEFRLGGER